MNNINNNTSHKHNAFLGEYSGQPILNVFRNGAVQKFLNSLFATVARPLITATMIPTGTTGAKTINTAAGSVNFAAAASSLVVTNSLVTTSSIVLVQVNGTDTTAKTATVTKANGSFTITLNAAATAETAVSFVVFN